MSLGHGASIVRDGLVLHLDAANIKSYPGSGTDLYDLSNITSVSTLNNGVIATNDVFTFDGVNDNISLPSKTLTAWTIGYWFYHDTTTDSDMTLGQAGFNANRFYHRDTGTTGYKLRVHNNLTENVYDMNIGEGGWQSWHQLFYSMDGNGSVKGWLDGEPVLDATVADSSEFVIDSIGFAYISGFFWQGSLNNIMVYTRQLSDNEIKQNFEATRGRYGI